MEKVTIRERLKAHVSRIQEWKLVELRPLPYEFKRLTEDGVTSPTLQSYSVWRRSMLLTALPSLIYSAIDSFVGVTNEINFEDLNAFGKFVYILPLLSGSVLTVGAAGAWWYWTNNSRSKSWAQACWITSLILPVIPNVFPIQWLVTSSYGAFLRENEAIFFLLRTQLSIASAATLMPILISFPLGMLRSALRIRGLLPDYSLAGWILIVVSPLYILIVTLCLILASQFVGTGLLLVGIAFLVAGPLIYLWKRKLFTESIITEMEAQVIKVQMVVRWTGLLGLFLVILWSFTATVEVQGIEVRLIGWSVENGGEVAPILTYAQWVRLVCLLVGFVLMSSLCFADIFIRFSLADWRTEIKRRDNFENENRDETYTSLNNELLGLKYRTVFQGSFSLLNHMMNNRTDPSSSSSLSEQPELSDTATVEQDNSRSSSIADATHHPSSKERTASLDVESSITLTQPTKKTTRR